MKAADAVFDALAADDVGSLRVLLQGDARLAAARDARGVSAVLRALYLGRARALELLLAAGPRLDLFEAAAVGALERVAALLDEDPADVRAFSPDGFTALHLAAGFGRVDVVALLLARGAVVDARTAAGWTALHAAAAEGELAVARLLLAAGAAADARGDDGRRAGELAREARHQALAELLGG